MTAALEGQGRALPVPCNVADEELVEPPEAMADAAVLLASQDASGITGTVQRSESLAPPRLS